MTALQPTLVQSAVVAAALKILLWPAYHSTDFEVHRNWLAITHSLPIKEWYYEKTSEWTLDYPPFFAWFELMLSQLAAFIDHRMLDVDNLEYDSDKTIYFQRASVILSELVLVYALLHFVKHTPSSERSRAHIAASSILLSPGLLIIDHIHFQYNGMMYGILILSVSYVRSKSGILLGGSLFAALLCFKHIYLYLAPAYFVFLLRTYCLSPRSIFSINFTNCIKLGLSIVTIVLLAFGPFIYYNQIPQVFSRLFPFSRGLCHAYWAPNVWALYSLLDRALIFVAPKLGLTVNEAAVGSVTRGLVGDTAFAVLPEITPRLTFMLTLGAQMPALIKLFFRPTWHNFVAALTLCGYASFLFGWHVHEKAILLVILPYSLIALTSTTSAPLFKLLAVSGHVSLLPLLFTPHEWLIKTAYTSVWLIVFSTAFSKVAAISKDSRSSLLDNIVFTYNLMAIPVVLYASFGHELLFGQKYEFLPLMLVSTYSAFAVATSWVGSSIVFLLG